ncbi:type IV pilin-like G/H family protein [Nodularia spumigena]|uniref:Fimbrial protein n=1 Tax=Nodularia spumigena UHCC 0039 TaxID=1914872 RepID=A0A2S0Q7L2_NODSP|nr:type IV pilin-like G/H family protein [Nodularia spumigena]AVZ30403.1 fimbrial protein [Nodularia spumigena UHCC 0039]
MKTELKAKFLQHILNKKKDESGFTLIELLVVIIIIGILSAIALPSFLNQAAKARQSEGKTFVGAVIRAQQAFRIENPKFTDAFTSLEIGLPTQTDNFTYVLAGNDTRTSSIVATALDTVSLKGFSGGVEVVDSGQTATAACQTPKVQSQTAIVAPKFDPVKGPDCVAAGMENMK